MDLSCIEAERTLNGLTPDILDPDQRDRRGKSCDDQDSGRNQDGTRHLEKETSQPGDEAVDTKGKRREQESARKDNRDISLPALDPASVIQPELSLKPPIIHASKDSNSRREQGVENSRADAAESKKPRAPRNRNLLESVHAHLATPLSRPPAKEGLKVDHQVDINANSSSLDPSTTTLGDSHATVVVPTPNATTPSQLVRLPEGSETSQRKFSPGKSDGQLHGNCTRTGMSAPEIMARTRARLAKTNSNKGAHRTDAAVAIVDRPSVNAIDNHIAGTPNLSNGQVSQPNDVRARLRTRLEDEKRHLASSLPEPLHSHEPWGPPADSQSPVPNKELTTDATEHLHSHAATMEAKLRLRAQLRVRLAAAKRNS
jgi:hypothetical protein